MGSGEAPAPRWAPNAGWFARTNDRVSRATLGNAPDRGHLVKVSSNSGAKAQPASWIPGVGHHWVPVSVLVADDIRPFLSDDAYQYALGSHSGKLTEAHNGRAYGNVTHPRYTQRVKEELMRFMKRYGIKKMTLRQMQRFVSLIENGLAAR